MIAKSASNPSFVAARTGAEIVGTGNNVSLSTSFNGTPIHDRQTTVGTLSAGPAGTYIYGPNTIAEFDDVRISTP